MMLIPVIIMWGMLGAILLLAAIELSVPGSVHPAFLLVPFLIGIPALLVAAR